MEKKLVAGHRGFVLSKRAKKYPETEPQKVMRHIIRFCGIRKGMTKAELMTAMKECVGPTMREYYDKG